jgi:hypothetical protein
MRQPAVITSASTNRVAGVSSRTPLKTKKRSRSSTPTRPVEAPRSFRMPAIWR